MSVAAQGALSMSSLRREASFEMQGTLLPRASVTWEAPLLVNRFERGTAQPLVTLKKSEETITQLNGSITEGTGDLVLPYTPIQIKFTDLLLPAPEHLLRAQAFRALWDRLAHFVFMDAVVEQSGERFLSEHLACERIRGPEGAIGFVDLPEIPAPNQLQAAGLCRTWNGDWLAYYCVGAYAVRPSERRAVNDSATDPATVSPTPLDETGTTPLDEAEQEAQEQHAEWKVQYEFRSTSEQVIGALRANSQQWLDDLTDEQVTLVNLYDNCTEANYQRMESVMFPGLSNLMLEGDMDMDEVLYRWNCLKRNRKNRYAEAHEEEAEGAEGAEGAEEE